MSKKAKMEIRQCTVFVFLLNCFSLTVASQQPPIVWEELENYQDIRCLNSISFYPRGKKNVSSASVIDCIASVAAAHKKIRFGFLFVFRRTFGQFSGTFSVISFEVLVSKKCLNVLATEWSFVKGIIVAVGRHHFCSTNLFP